MKGNLRFMALLALPMAFAAQAARANRPPYELACPTVLDRSAVLFANAAIPSGWTPYMPLALDVRSAHLLYGPPDAQRPAIPLSRVETSKENATTWDFSDIPEDEKWLSCTYGRGGELTLARPLPQAISSCTVTVTKIEHGWVSDVKVRCTPHGK